MKIGLVSLGCPKNLVDSEVMLGLAQRAGHQLTGNPSEADVLVVNTCAFIDKAKRESVDTILEMAEHKKVGRCRTLVVAGCMAERYGDELRREIPEIDAVLGTGDVESIVQAIGTSVVSSPAPRVGAPLPILRANGEAIPLNSRREPERRPTYLYGADTPRLLATPRHYAYIKIAEGCDYACAFCIIPTLRGGYRSRSEASIVQEAHALSARGVKELLLISQDTSFYGVDLGTRGALASLLRALNAVPGIEWIRMLYLYPTTIGDDVLAAIVESPKVCRYIDLPLQHASDSVLKRMKRPGTRASYGRLLERIRATLPGVTLRTTFIVGFPGETEEDFAVLQEFVRTTEFDHVGVFTYSHEEGTSAHALADDVPEATKRAREKALMRVQKSVVAKKHRAMLGHRVRLLVDGPSAEHDLVLRARLEGHAPEIDPVVYLTDCDPSDYPPGEFLEAEVVGSRGYDLLARPIGREGP